MKGQIKMNVRFATVVEFLNNSKISEKTFANFEAKGFNDKLVKNGGVAIPNGTNFSWYKSTIKKFEITKEDVDAWKKEIKVAKPAAKKAETKTEPKAPAKKAAPKAEPKAAEKKPAKKASKKAEPKEVEADPFNVI